MTTSTAEPTSPPIKTTLPERFRDDRPAPLATALGLFSIGLGLAEVLAPRFLGEVTGVRYPALLRAYGVREIGSGIGLLTARRPAGWLWARVAGDVLDLATFAAAVGTSRSDDDRAKAVTAATAVAGVTVLDVLCACSHS